MRLAKVIQDEQNGYVPGSVDAADRLAGTLGQKISISSLSLT